MPKRAQNQRAKSAQGRNIRNRGVLERWLPILWKKRVLVIELVGFLAASGGVVWWFVRNPMQFETERVKHATELNKSDATSLQRMSAISNLQDLAQTKRRARKVFRDLDQYFRIETPGKSATDRPVCPTPGEAFSATVNQESKEASAVVRALARVYAIIGADTVIDYSEAYLPNVELMHVSLRHFRLNGACLIGADLRQADLRGTKLNNAILSKARLNRADLTGAELSDASLQGTQLVQATLVRARLARANLSGADLTSANFNLAILPEADLSGVQDPRNTSFAGAYMEGVIYGRNADWRLIGDIESAYMYDPQDAPAGFLDLVRAKGAITDNLSQEDWARRKEQFEARRKLQ